jgi:hypothetical protein
MQCATDTRRFQDIPKENPELKTELDKLYKDADGASGAAPAYDKNSPSSLKQLRWAIYEFIDSDRYNNGLELKQEVERLFKDYTNS